MPVVLRLTNVLQLFGLSVPSSHCPVSAFEQVAAQRAAKLASSDEQLHPERAAPRCRASRIARAAPGPQEHLRRDF